MIQLKWIQSYLKSTSKKLNFWRKIMNKAVITVIGKDTTGIIAKVSNLLYEHDINILDISEETIKL